jgi:hypothetical protein
LSGAGQRLNGQRLHPDGKGDPANDPAPNPWNPNGTIPFGGTLAAKTIPRYVRDSQYPMFVGPTSSYTFGWSNYDSLIVEVKHAYSYGLQLDAHYTWSKALDYTGAEAANSEASSGVGFDSGSRYLKSIANNYHLSYSDIPNRFVITAIYATAVRRRQTFRPRRQPCAERNRERMENRRSRTYSKRLPDSHLRGVHWLAEFYAEPSSRRATHGVQGVAALV